MPPIASPANVRAAVAKVDIHTTVSALDAFAIDRGAAPERALSFALLLYKQHPVWLHGQHHQVHGTRGSIWGGQPCRKVG